MRTLHRSVVVKRELSVKAKLSIYRSIYVPTLTYGHELWVVTERTRSRIQAAEMSFLRRVAGLSLRDRVRSSAIREGLRVECGNHVKTCVCVCVRVGMLLAGLLLRNVPYITDAIFIDTHWSAALRNIALSIILTRAGLGLNPEALSRLKAVCVRVAVGPCMVEACIVAVVSHFLLGLPWVWGFILGFVLAAVSPAVVVPSMLLLQREGYGVEKGIPTLLMAAGSFDDILAITGFSTCLGIAFSTGQTKCFCPVLFTMTRRTLMLLGLSTFSVFFSHVIGFAGAGGLCTLVLAFLAALGWKTEKAPVAEMVGRSWDVFQPLLFGLIGAEITIKALSPSTVGLGMACILIGLVIRLLVTFLLVHYGGFNLKEKLFISVAWLPKATVQAAIGSKALDMFGLDVLTLAVLAILTTAPVGALGIGLAGPRLLARQVKGQQAYTSAHCVVAYITEQCQM
uniref:Sodium/hydrogen exchanger 9B2 n=1 Tax=Maylandia zebra TaxID=106582 RepID=A0A3P9DJT6_9CICH